MKRLSFSIVIFALVTAGLMTGCGKSHVDEGTVISVIYSTDTHGKLEGCGCKKNGGGITRRAAKLEAARAEDGTVLYLDAGNFLSGSAPENEGNNDAIIAAYNQMGATVVNVSERELARGIEAFRQAKKDSKFDYVSANVRFDGGSVADAYVMKKVKNANVAIVGLCGTKETMRYDSSIFAAQVTVVDPLSAAKEVIPPLTGKADIIIVLSTCGDATDSLIARDFQMVHLIIGGRSYRPNSDSPWVLGNARVVRTERDGKSLGRMDMVFGAERNIKTYSASTLRMETSDPSSAEMLALVRRHIPNFVDHPTAP
jgi:5'-nucleotidase